MQVTPNEIQFNIWMSMMISISGYLFTRNRILTRLRSQYKDEWVNLGEPNIITNNSMRNTWRFLEYMFRKDYKKLKDGTINRYYYVLYILFFSSMFLYITMLILVFMDPAKPLWR